MKLYKIIRILLLSSVISGCTHYIGPYITNVESYDNGDLYIEWCRAVYTNNFMLPIFSELQQYGCTGAIKKVRPSNIQDADMKGSPYNN